MHEEENQRAEIAVQMNVNRNKYLDEVVQVNTINYIYTMFVSLLETPKHSVIDDGIICKHICVIFCT
jgi:hypothetical protein